MSEETNDEYAVTPLNKVLRMRKRAIYDRAAVRKILKCGVMASVGIIGRRATEVSGCADVDTQTAAGAHAA